MAIQLEFCYPYVDNINSVNSIDNIILKPEFSICQSHNFIVILRLLFTLLLSCTARPPLFCLNLSCSVSASWHNRKPLSKRSMKVSAVISSPEHGTHKDTDNKFIQFPYSVEADAVLLTENAWLIGFGSCSWVYVVLQKLNIQIWQNDLRQAGGWEGVYM